ncbi:hypothetical protein BGX26_012240 [Mortierella sp. AD094]|nr:hypothetical protein BGX26_012240 [Mortierella sp. AD094]
MTSYYLRSKSSRILMLSILCFLALLAASSWTTEAVAMVSAAPVSVKEIVAESHMAQEFTLSPSSQVSEVESISVTQATNKGRLDRRQTHVPGTGTGVGGDYNKGDPSNRK